MHIYNYYPMLFEINNKKQREPRRATFVGIVTEKKLLIFASRCSTLDTFSRKEGQHKARQPQNLIHVYDAVRDTEGKVILPATRMRFLRICNSIIADTNKTGKLIFKVYENVLMPETLLVPCPIKAKQALKKERAEEQLAIYMQSLVESPQDFKLTVA